MEVTFYKDVLPILQENCQVCYRPSGVKRGNPKDAPAGREWPGKDGWTIGTPDLIHKTVQVFFVEDDVEDLYVDLSIKITDEMLSEDKFIMAVEFRPGSSAVHHIIALPLGGIAPGNEASINPDGIASVLEKGTEITRQTPVYCRGLFF